MISNTINIIGILVLFGWFILSFFLVFVFRLRKYDRQKFIKILSSPIMYKNTNFKAIAANNRKALNRIKPIRKKLIYPCIIVSVAILFLWRMSGEYLKNVPKSVFMFTILAMWLAFLTIRTIEYYLEVINKRIENELIGNENE